MPTTTLRAEILKDMNVALEREHILFLDYDRNPRLVTLNEHRHLFTPAEGYYGPYTFAITRELLDVPLYLGEG